MCVVVPLILPKGPLRPLLDTPAHGAVEASSLPSTIQSYRRLIPHQRRRTTSPLRHLPMSERAAVRSQIRGSLQAPPIPPWQPFRRLNTSKALEIIPLHRCTRTMDQGRIAALETPLAKRFRSPCTHRPCVPHCQVFLKKAEQGSPKSCGWLANPASRRCPQWIHFSHVRERFWISHPRRARPARQVCRDMSCEGPACRTGRAGFHAPVCPGS